MEVCLFINLFFLNYVSQRWEQNHKGGQKQVSHATEGGHVVLMMGLALYILEEIVHWNYFLI